jgi:hypothetical protein
LLVNFWLEIVSKKGWFSNFQTCIFFLTWILGSRIDFFNFGLVHYFWLKSLQAGLVFQFWVSAFWLEFASKVFQHCLCIPSWIWQAGWGFKFQHCSCILTWNCKQEGFPVVVSAFWLEFSGRMVFQDSFLMHSDFNFQTEQFLHNSWCILTRIWPDEWFFKDC